MAERVVGVQAAVWRQQAERHLSAPGRQPRGEFGGPDAVSREAAFRLLRLTGCRISEIQFLRSEYVKDDCIELPAAKTGGRIVPLGPEARAVLANLPHEDGNPWVIRGKLPGSHITDLQRPWRRFRARAGLQDVRIHDLRHSYASRALALDESLTMIRKLLGHRQGRPPRGMLTLPAIRSKTPPRGSPAALETISWAARLQRRLGRSAKPVAPLRRDRLRSFWHNSNYVFHRHLGLPIDCDDLGIQEPFLIVRR